MSRPTQLIDLFEANFTPIGKSLSKLSSFVTKNGLSIHEISKRTGHTRAFLSKQLRNFGIENPNSKKRFAPYGWDINGYELVMNSKEQAVLFEIQKLNQSGLGCKAIAKKLNEQKIPAKGGNRWGHSSVQNILNRQKKERG